MPLYRVPSNDGLHKVRVTTPKLAGHVLSIAPEPLGSGGVVTVKARASGGSTFEPIDGGTVDLATNKSIVFNFAVAEYSFEVSGASEAKFLCVTDIEGDI